jgi:hypothetical protein
MRSLLLITLVLTGCAYHPVIDTAGRSGTFPEATAVEMTNDIQHCKQIGEDNTYVAVEGTKVVYNYYVRPALLWLPGKADFTYKKIVKKCLENRGHSVLK